jgi:hypothetical protein
LEVTKEENTMADPAPDVRPAPDGFDDKHPWYSIYRELRVIEDTLKQVLSVGQQVLLTDQQILEVLKARTEAAGLIFGPPSQIQGKSEK